MNDAVQNNTVKIVNRIFQHPDFNPITLDNDVAILNIESFKWTNNVEILTSIDKPTNLTYCYVIGWGKSENSEPLLQKILAKITEDEECRREYSYNASHKFCIQALNDSCLEEPGSGLICDEELTGILSYGYGCSEPGKKPMVYSDLTKYNIWIDEVFRTVITKNNDELVTQTVQNLENQQTTSTPVTTDSISTSVTVKKTSTSVSQYSSPPTIFQSENVGHW